MRYVMLGSTFGSLLACIFLVRYLLEMPQRVEVLLPMKRIAPGEFAEVLASGQDHTITVDADGTVLLGEKVIGNPEDLTLFSLSLAVLHRRVKDETAAPLIIRVSPQTTHARMMAVMNALAAVREKRYIVTFTDSPATELSWREG
jgi:biopolymer transport protein ExbD